MAQFLYNSHYLPRLFAGREDRAARKLFIPLRRATSYLPRKSRRQLYNAYMFAYHAHYGQDRASGEPFISHPIEVAVLLAELKLDAETLIAAVLHDVVEDTDHTQTEVANAFGSAVGAVVGGVSKLERIHFDSVLAAQAANLQKMMLAMASDLRVLLIKLADRVHNVRSLDVFSLEKRRRIGHETLDIYAPLAARIGIYGWRVELENKAFAAVDPWRFNTISKAIRSEKGARSKNIEQVVAFVSRRLRESDISAILESREKHCYSVYSKMRNRKIRFRDVLDLFACRIIVRTVDDCYRALGLVHSLFKPRPGRFKDYIALPKSNGYQSLHTVLFGPLGAHMEIQIRTHKMHEHARQGLAAHWHYKQTGSEVPSVDRSFPTPDWLHNFIEIGKGGATSSEFLESVEHDLFPFEVYVFTPQGKVIVLPKGSTPIDFAYAIHTDVGNHCVGAKVDNELVSMETPLQSGQMVQIVSSRFGRPSPEWLDFCVTSKARVQVRSYLKSLRRDEVLTLGGQLLDQALEKHNDTLAAMPEKNKQKLLRKLKVGTFEDLLYQVGTGTRPARLVIAQIDGLDEEVDTEEKPLLIRGSEGMAITFGKCCQPIPGDMIMGYLSADKGLVIHRVSCHNIKRFRKKPASLVVVRWQQDDHERLPVSIHLECENKVEVTAEVVRILKKMGADIDSVNAEKGLDTVAIRITARVFGRTHLAHILQRLRKLPSIHKVTRGRG